MQAALDSLRSAFEHGSVKGTAAALAALWAAYWHHASSAFIVALLVGLAFGVMDTGLGFGRAWIDRRVDPDCLRKFVSKSLAYTALLMVSMALGWLLDAHLGASELQAGYALPTGVATMLAATEALSCLRHVAAMTNGQFNLKWLQAIAERLAQPPAADGGDADA